LWLLRTFGDGCPEVLVIQAFMQFSHFWGYRSNNFFNSMREAEDTSPKVRKTRFCLPQCGLKPTVLDGRKSSNIHARPLTR
jgi:hypothetical protein